MDDKKPRSMLAQGSLVDRFPSNSSKSKKVEEKEIKIKKIVKGPVVRTEKKEGFFTKLKYAFLSDEVDSVGGYVIHEVLIPAAKSTISDIVNGGLEMILFGTVSGNRKRHRDSNRYGSSSIDYRGLSNSRDNRHYRDDRRQLRRNSILVDDITLSREDAKDVLGELQDLIQDYGCATIANYYEMVGEPSAAIDNKYGWENLGRVELIRVRNGWVIDLPKPIEVD